MSGAAGGVPWEGYGGHGDRLYGEIADALEEMVGGPVPGPGLACKILRDEVVVALERDAAGEEGAVLAAVFSAESPEGLTLLKESHFHPHQFYLDGEDPEGLAEPARVVVDPSPAEGNRALYERVGAVRVPDGRAAAGELLALVEARRAARGRLKREASRSGSDLERLRAKWHSSAAERSPVLSTGQLESRLEREAERLGGGLLARLLGLVGFGRRNRGELPDPGPDWRRRIPYAAYKPIKDSDCPGVAVVTMNKGGSGKCVALDTLLTDPVTGRRHTVAEFVERPDLSRVHTLVGRRKTTGAGITAKVDSGVKPTLRVRLKSGRSITVTRHHPLLLPDGWRKTEEVAVGETIALAAREPFPEEPVRLHDAEVDLLAAMLAEGGTAGASTTFNTADEGTVRLVANAAAELEMELRPRPTARYRYDLCNVERGARDPAGRGRVRAFLDRHGLSGRLAKHKRMPEAVFRLDPEQLSRFLSVFWMCDGYVGKREGPGITLASKRLVEDVQHLLLRFGVQSRVEYKKSGYTAPNGERREFDAWRLTVYSQYRRRFRDSVQLWGEKRARLDELCEKAENPNRGSPTMSEKLLRELRTAAFGSPNPRPRGGAGHVPGGPRSKGGLVALEAPPSTRDVRDLLGWASFQTDFLEHKKGDGRTGTIARKPFAAFCEVFGLREEYGWLLDSLAGDSDVFWDEVISVEDAGERQVYDLMVEPTRCFLANDVFVHNTTIAINLAAVVSLIGVPKGSKTGLNVLIVEQNYNNSDVRDRLRLQGAPRPGLLGFVEDLRAGYAPKVYDYATPVSGLPNLDVLLISDQDNEFELEGTFSEAELDALYDSAARDYDMIVVDLDQGLPQAPNMRGDVLRFWMSVSDVTYLALDGTNTSVKEASKFVSGAKGFFEEEAKTGGAPRPVVAVRNKWREGERWGESADDEAVWEQYAREIGADWAIDRDGGRVPFLTVPDDPQADAFTHQARLIGLSDWAIADALEELAREWIYRVYRSRAMELGEGAVSGGRP